VFENVIGSEIVLGIMPKHCDNKVCLRHFRMTKSTFEIQYNEIVLLVSPVIKSHPLSSIEGFIQ